MAHNEEFKQDITFDDILKIYDLSFKNNDLILKQDNFFINIFFKLHGASKYLVNILTSRLKSV